MTCPRGCGSRLLRDTDGSRWCVNHGTVPVKPLTDEEVAELRRERESRRQSPTHQ